MSDLCLHARLNIAFVYEVHICLNKSDLQPLNFRQLGT